MTDKVLHPKPIAADPKEHAVEYEKYLYKKWLFIIFLLIAVFVVSIAYLGYGDYPISFIDVIKILFGADLGDTPHFVVWTMRLPTVVAAILVGGALAASGVVMQSVLRNPLASPYTLGISNAAAFGAAFAIMISITIFSGTVVEQFFSGPYGVSMGAFIWAMIAVFIVITISKMVYSTPESVVLVGVALNAIFLAGLSAFQFFADETQLGDIVFWQFGDLSKANWTEVIVLFVIFALVALYFFYKRWDYNAMDCGDEIAESLGTNAKDTRMMGMVLATLLTAVAVSIVGIIGFVGLLAPHMTKKVIGNDNRYVLPASILLGALILLVSVFIGSWAFRVGIPVGIITSLIGGPVFIAIYIKSVKRTRSPE
ncbi:FecCD family ABC transporter permease [Candidatus Methanomassiliicoccus intestinalis]|uniref:FecCD family ABC transporter permease n=1 Tax=Candidatus Methanomassiliicoccus intestinalis TaxID=1406512 RepID=UPI0037DD388B